MLTAKGILWSAAGLALAVVGLGLNAPAVSLLGIAMGLHVALAWARLGSPKLEGDLTLHRDPLTEHESLPLTATLTNRSRRPTLVRYRVDLPGTFEQGERPAAGTTILSADQTERIDADVTPGLHGPYEVGPLRVLAEDPGGIVVRDIEVSDAQRLLCFPRVEDLRDQPLKSRMATPYIGLHEVQQPGDGFEFYALRQYESGDSIRMINWRASARTEEMIVNQRVKESFAKVTVLLDGRAWEGMGIRKHAPWFRGARAAAALAEAFMGARDRVTFRVLGDEVHEVKPQAPTRQRRQILETIAGHRPTGTRSLAAYVEEILPRLRPRSLFVLVTSLEGEPGIGQAVKQLRAREIPVLVVTPGSRWPDDVDDETVQQALDRRQRQLDECRGAGATVIEFPPDQLLTVTVQQAVLA